MTPTKTRTSGRSAKRAAISGSQPSLPTPQERSAAQRVRAGASQQASREVLDGGGGGGISGRAVLKVQEISVVRQKRMTEVRTVANSATVGVYCFRHGKFEGKVCPGCRAGHLKHVADPAAKHALEVYRDLLPLVRAV